MVDRVARIGLTLVVALGTSPGFAANVYFGAGVGTSEVSGISEDDLSISRSFPPPDMTLRGLGIEDRDSTWRLFAGYQFLPRLALEAGYSDLGTFDLDNALNINGSLSIESVTFSGRWNVPVNDVVNLTGRLGFAHAKFEAEGGFDNLILLPFGGIVRGPFTPLARSGEHVGAAFRFRCRLENRPQVGVDLEL